MAPKLAKEEAPDIESTRSQFITKLTATADAMRKFSNFADALAKVVLKVPLDDPEIVEALQGVIDATPPVSRKRKLADLTEDAGKRRKREKKAKDPNAPKAPPSAYIMFQNDVRNRVRAEHPGVQYKELMGMISKQWNALPTEKKQPYFDRVTDAKKNHEVDMAKYIAEHPALEEASSSKKVKKAPEASPATIEAVMRKFAPVVAPKADSSDSGSDEGSDTSEDEGQAANGKPSDDEVDDSDSDEQSVAAAPKEASPPRPAKKAKKSDKSEKRK